MTRAEQFLRHPLAHPAEIKSCALGLRSGDRFIYTIDNRHGRADEFMHDGDAFVTFDDGTYGTIKWNHMTREIVETPTEIGDNPMYDSEFNPIYAEVRSELERALAEYPSFHSAHEGWAVIKEELDELWDEVRKPQRDRHTRNGVVEHEGPNLERQRGLRKEALQVAAMAMRFLLEMDQFKN